MPSTSRTAPISSGATSWTLRAKKSVRSARVVACEGRYGKGDQDGTRDASEAARDDREAQAGERGDDAGFDIAERGRRGDLGELDPREPSAERIRRDRPEDGAAQHGADVVRGAGGREEYEREPERLREPEGDDRSAPETCGNGHDQTLASYMADPAREQRGGKGAGVRRRVHEPENPCA